MPALEDLWPGTAALRKEVIQLRQQLARAIEMLQIMQEELQAAHDELAKHSQ
jgi:hypothetical protein